MSPILNLAKLPDRRKAIIIRTSDRITFKQCRRKWAWSSHLKRNLGSKNMAGPLWFGSAIHYALEDYHGFKAFDSAADAFRAYCIATSKQHIRDLPEDAPVLYKLGTAMMEYYTNDWLRTRQADETYYHPDPITGVLVPQVEVNFEIEIPLDEFPVLKAFAGIHGADCVLYRGTIDRVAIDAFGRLWVVEYKTAKIAEHMHYQTDSQVTTYVWAATHIYGRPVAGVVYMQFVKNEPVPPRILSTGKISTASNLVTSAPLYRRQLENIYGTAEKAPADIYKFYVDLMSKEDENKDRFIHREYIERNKHFTATEAQKILLELEDILNPDLPLYPNPTRDCSRMCSFLGACVSFDDGGDWEGNLMEQFSARDQAPDRLWRNRLPSAEKMLAIRELNKDPDLNEAQYNIQAMTPKAREAIERGEADIEFTFNM